ncbi:MAG TPA: Ku protein [Actinomycetota bacterium]|nr:Ku protein [Actinomycetota bacterium]
MPRAVWSGTLSFGLVSIPVRLYNATVPRDVRFHQFDRETGRRVRYRRVVEYPGHWEAPEPPGPEEGLEEGPRPEGAPARPSTPEPARAREVPWEDVVKGFEVTPGRYVTVTREELEAVRPEQPRTIEVQEFVPLAQIDPVFFDRSYYLAPERGAERPYALLLEAMRRAGRVAIGRFVLRSRPHLAAIRPVDGALVLETLFFSDEVREPKEVEGLPVLVEPDEREVEVAVTLVELLAANWEPGRYRDEYRERVLELVRAKAQAEGAVVEAPPEPAAEARVEDLLAALRASVEALRSRRASEAGGGQGTGRRAPGRRARGAIPGP